MCCRDNARARCNSIVRIKDRTGENFGCSCQVKEVTGGVRRVPMPRHIAFGDADCTAVTLSRDGLRIACLERRAGVLNLIVRPVNALEDAAQLTRETSRSLMPVLVWGGTGQHVIIFRDLDGRENYRAFSVNVETGAEIALTPGDGVRAWCLGYSPSFPAKLLFGLNARDRRFFDVFSVDIITGQGEVIFENTRFSKLHTDRNFVVRFGERVRADGSAEILEARSNADWLPFLEIPAADVLTTRLDRLAVDGQSAFLLDSRGRDKTALYELHLATHTATLLIQDPHADITDVVYDPATQRPLVALATALRQHWHTIVPAFGYDLDQLFAEAGDAELEIIDIADDMNRYLVFVDRSNAAGEFWLYQPGSRSVVKLFKNRSNLDGLSLRPMQAVTITATDGLKLPSYLTLPEDKFRHGPMVLLIHGGPYDRDRWGYSAMHQWLVSRGYAVLSVNFRGSTGFGKAFVNASDREWGGRMQDDLSDGVAWAVQHGYADPARVGVAGVSYGGYAALMGAAQTPEKFACVVAISGPSNLITFIESIPTYWHSWFAAITSRLADPSTGEGRTWLTERSPSTHVNRIVRPMLLVQGLNDVRVKPQESERIVQALQDRGVPVTYLTFSDEGHFFARQENRIALSAVMEAFLAQHLGGAAEPLDEAFVGSGIRFRAGG